MPPFLATPLTILTCGVAALAVLMAAQLAGFGGALAAPHALAALLVFGVGLAFAGYLWWLSARSFALLRDPATTPAQIAALRELPMALPEGTVRAVLALIVGVIGLPLLLFSQALSLNDAVAGYVNGIIAGVFGYYFGARGNGGEALAGRRLGEALGREQQVSEALRRSEAQARAAAERAGEPERLGRLATGLERQVQVARVILDQLAPALPPGLLPAGAGAALARAEQALASGRGEEAALRAAATALAGEEGPFPALLRAAAVLLPAATPLGGPLGGVAVLLGVGWNLGSAAWRRFRARLLDAPHDPALFEPGAITPESAELRLAEAPIFARLFAARAAEPGFLAALLDTCLREDAAERLWTGHPGFADPAEAAAGLAEFRRALLAERVAADLTPEVLARLPEALRTRPPGFPRPGPPEAQAAMQALTLLLGELRERRIDPLPLLAEVVA